MNKQLHLAPDNPSGELLTYGGLLDICNGERILPEDLTRLKTAALFYDRIIVEDGYLHCYGPIYSHFARLLSGSGGDPLEDELTQLIRAGVLVPALRTGDSLHDNFVHSRRGIEPGKFLTLPDTDISRKVLRFLDDQVHHSKRGKFALQPDSLKDKGVQDFSRLVGQAIYDETSEVSVFHYLDREGLQNTMNTDKLRLLNFAASVGNVAYESGFRRGAVENKIREYLKLEPTKHIYGEIIQHCEAGSTTFEVYVSLYLLWVASTAYELTHAAAFGTLGGLFSAHEPHLVTAGIFDNLNDIVHYDFRGITSNQDYLGNVLDL